MKITDESSAEVDRVRRHTSPRVNARIDAATRANIDRYRAEPADVVARRIDELDREWDIERVLETNASVLALTGVVLAAAVNRRWLLLSGGVLTFLLMHATQGWCPPLPYFRARGVRTRGEIDEEKFALLDLLERRYGLRATSELREDAAARTPTQAAPI